MRLAGGTNRVAFGEADSLDSKSIEHAQASSIEHVLAAWFKQNNKPKAILQHDLRIIIASGGFIEVGIAYKAFTIKNGKLDIHNREFRRALDMFTSAEGDSSDLVFRSNESPSHYVIVTAQKLDFAESAPAIFWEIHGIRHRELAMSSIKSIFKLTEAELVVLHLLYSGHTVHEISQVKSLSVDTIRTHVRQIYVKTDVRTREALMAKLNYFTK